MSDEMKYTITMLLMILGIITGMWILLGSDNHPELYKILFSLTYGMLVTALLVSIIFWWQKVEG